jgi:hypothetical protein
VNLLVVAAALLVLAQLVGIYGLLTRKADVIFTIVMVVLLAGAAGFGALDLYHRLH